METLQGLLGKRTIRGLTLVADKERVVRADLLVADRLDQLIHEHGAKIYERWDAAAKKQLEEGVEEGDARKIEDVARLYPTSTVAPSAWQALAKLRAEKKQHSEAASAYRRMLTASKDDAGRAAALYGLAGVYEAEKQLRQAKQVYLQILDRFSSVQLSDGSGKRLGEIVRVRLGKAPFDKSSLEEGNTRLAPPLVRKWFKRWDSLTRPVVAEPADRTESGRLFLVEKTTIKPIDPVDGRSPWSVDLKEEPKWIGWFDDRVVVALKSKICALAAADGGILWQFNLKELVDEKREANPFARDVLALGDAKAIENDRTLRDFCLSGGRLYCFRGSSELLAFDAETGLLEWSHKTAADSINPNHLIGPRRIVLQNRQPSAVVVLDAESGKQLAEYPGEEDDEAWPRPPVALDDERVLLVNDRLTVSLLELSSGRTAWTFQESKVMPTRGPPRVMCDGERVLVLHDGAELIRLDPASGSKLWSTPLGAEDLSERSEAVVVSGSRCYYASGASRGLSTPTLSAISLDNGSLLWSRHLEGPRGGWALAPSDQTIAAFPGASSAVESDVEALPLAVYSLESGEVIQRFLFPSETASLTINFVKRGALVATPWGVWSLAGRDEPVDSAHGLR